MKLVLVIDDDVSMLKLLERHLTTRGFQVLEALSPDRGLELARTGNPDFIILDIDMPGISGIEVLKTLRKEDLTKNTPVIMLTAHGDKELVRQCLQYGITDYLIKPYDPDKLAQKINSALEWNAVHGLNAESIERPILVTRAGGRVTVQFLESPGSVPVLTEASRLFGPVFLKQTLKDLNVFDLRNLTELSDRDIMALKTIFKVFAGRQIFVVSGRNFGQILGEFGDAGEIRNFLSPDEIEQFVTIQ